MEQNEDTGQVDVVYVDYDELLDEVRQLRSDNAALLEAVTALHEDNYYLITSNVWQSALLGFVIGLCLVLVLKRR